MQYFATSVAYLQQKLPFQNTDNLLKALPCLHQDVNTNPTSVNNFRIVDYSQLTSMYSRMQGFYCNERVACVSRNLCSVRLEINYD